MSRRHRSASTRTAVLALCVLLSGAYHAGLVIGLSGLLDSEEPVTAEPKITYLELKDLPTPETPEEEPPRDPEKQPTEEPKLEEPELEFEELPEPEEEQPEEQPPEEQPQEPVPPEHFVLEQLKMVEQPDELDEKEVPEDAEYLSNVNRDVTEQTRAEITNLEQDALKQQAAQLEDSSEKTTGTANEEKIAETREQKSRLDRQAPKVTPERNPTQAEQNDPKPKSLLAMRNLEQRDHKIASDEREPLAEQTDDGQLLPERQHQASVEARDQQARSEEKNERYKFRLSQNDLDAAFGRDIDAKAKMVAQRQSKTKGVWDDARAHWQSPLENMVPEVQVGNQTALRSRKHPFARFIAQMHRDIHDGWAYGYLEQLDTRGRGHPLNDFALWTNVEIVLNRDGTIDKVRTIHFSGQSAFDAAAREVVYAAGPFPDPPPEILSGNGKIYVHWRFHRNELACGTFGAEPYILDNAGQGDRPDAHTQIQVGERETRRLRRQEQHAHGPRRVAPAVAEGPAAPSHAHGGEHAHDHAHPHGESATEARASEPSAEDAEALKIANTWLAYFSKGDVGKAVARSTLPFYSGEAIVAKSSEELSSILTHLAVEANSGGKPKAAKIFTAAELRRLFGGLPQGVQEGEDRLYGLTKVGTEYLILFLERKFGVWRVSGLGR